MRMCLSSVWQNFAVSGAFPSDTYAALEAYIVTPKRTVRPAITAYLRAAKLEKYATVWVVL
jgi:hypothetical protein